MNKTEELGPEDFDKNKTTVVLTSNQWLSIGLLNKLRLLKTRFVCIPGPDDLPETIKVKNLFSFFNLDVPGKLQPSANQYSNDLSPDYKGLVLLEIIKTIEADIYIFNNFLSGLSDKFGEYFADSLQAMKKNDRKIVYFSNSMAISSKIADDILRLLDDNLLF